MAPITKKTTTVTTAKLGAGLKSSSIGKTSSFGSSKASTVLGSSGKSGKSLNYSEKTGSFFGATSKSSSEKHSYLEPKSSHLGYSTKTSNILGASGKDTSLGFGKNTPSKTANILGSSEKNTFTPPKDKTTTFTPPKDKSTNPFLGKTPQYDSSHNYPTFINAKSNKPSASFGIIWLPTRKHKKKESVYNSHNYDSYKNRSPSMYSNYMSGDSPDYQTHKKKEEEALLVSERPKVASVAVNTGITAANIDIPPDGSEKVNPEEKQELIRRDTEESKEAAGDTKDREDDDDKDYLENKDSSNKPENKWDSEKQNDKVDSVYLRPPPPHKSRSNTTTTNEEEDCGIKCLYYTLQCCDCVLQ